MLVSKIQKADLSADMIDRLLFKGIVDPGEKADCIIVLGSSKASEYRVPAAAAAYHAGRSGKIMLCGGVLRDFSGETLSEAEHMKTAAIHLGVKEKDILIENSSQNTIENILYAMVELQRSFYLNRIRSLILVTNAYHMRRSLAIARYLLPAHISVFPCPANDQNTRRENWMNTPAGTERAREEAINLIRCAASGIIPDFDI